MRTALLVALATLPFAGGCTWLSTQRWPRPMKQDVNALPPGVANSHPRGPEEVTVLRHADPVRVRRPGALSSYPLAFYERRVRMLAGSAVLTDTGGRAEILWPTGSSAVLFDQCIGWIGSPSQGGPTFELEDVQRADLFLQPGDQVRLMGGAVLSGSSGPYAVVRIQPDVQRIVNQSKGMLEVYFREQVFELGPSQKVDLPLVSSGGEPRVLDPSLQRISVGRFNVLVAGELETTVLDERARLRATGAGEAYGQGVRVRLEPGEEAVFAGLGRPPESGNGPEAESAESPASAEGAGPRP